MSYPNRNRAYQKLSVINKIAVLRANALGDFLFTLPALDALRNAYSAAEIVLLAQSWHAEFLAQRPSPINRVIVVPPYGGVSAEPGSQEDPLVLKHFFEQMVQERFDLAIQLHGGGGHSNLFVQRLGARLTVGLKAPEALPLDRWVPYVYFQPEIMRYLEVVALVGATPTTIEPHIVVTEEDLSEVYAVVSDDPRPLIALHPGTSDIRRRWSPQKFARVGDALATQGARIVITGVKAEQATTAAVVASMRQKAGDVTGQLSLNGLVGLLSRCQLVISNDTGPLHLAYAIGTSSIGLYWAYNAWTAGEPMRTRHRPLISWRMNCPVCGRDNASKRCEHQVSFIDDIEVEEVIATAQEMLRNYVLKAQER